MGIKERERRVEVFFYGLFMDVSCVGKGLEPEGGEIAAIDGFTLRIGQRAALVPTPGVKVYGLVFSLTRSELDRLYSESSVQACKPQAVLAQLASGGVVAEVRCDRGGHVHRPEHPMQEKYLQMTGRPAKREQIAAKIRSIRQSLPCHSLLFTNRPKSKCDSTMEKLEFLILETSGNSNVKRTLHNASGY